MSCRNLKDVNLVSVKNVSTYDIVNSNMLLFDKPSVEHINEGFLVMNNSDVILYPILTEKSSTLMESLNKYVFRVNVRSNKIQIKKRS